MAGKETNGKQRQIDQIMDRFDGLEVKIDKVHDCVLLLDNEHLPERMRTLETAKIEADTRAAVVKAVGAVIIKLTAVLGTIIASAYTVIKLAADLVK